MFLYICKNIKTKSDEKTNAIKSTNTIRTTSRIHLRHPIARYGSSGYYLQPKTLKMETEKAIFIRTFKTVRADGHAIRTTYALTESGIVNIERTILSTELNKGFKYIRKFGNLIYQCETMVFKLESFIKISNSVRENLHKLDSSKILRTEDVICYPNEKKITKIYIDKTKLK